VAASFYSPSVAAPSCCTPAPAVSAPSTFAVPNGGTVIQSAPAVSTPAPASAAPPQTYDENTAPSLNGASQRTYDSSLRAVPDNNVNRSPNGGFRPLFKQPESRTTGLQDRTASLNSGDATAGRTTGAASNTVQAVYSQPASVQIDDGGWRAARR
jgi:hypothetical protein